MEVRFILYLFIDVRFILSVILLVVFKDPSWVMLLSPMSLADLKGRGISNDLFG